MFSPCILLTAAGYSLGMQSDVMQSDLILSNSITIFQGKCLEHAQSCVRQARLIYLQISLLSSGQQVVNLEPQQVKSFIEQHDKFSHVSLHCLSAASQTLIIHFCSSLPSAAKPWLN